MAASLAPQPLSSLSFLRPRALKTLTLVLPFPRNPNPRCKSRPPSTSLLSSSPRPRRSFHASFSGVAESDPKVINGDEANQIQGNESDSTKNEKASLSMKTLIQSYKKAILDGDESTFCELEAAICMMENEKNDLSRKYAEIKTETASGRDKYLRFIADFENYRKRSEKDRLTFTSDIKAEVIESLLPLVDSFEKAKQQMRPETEKEEKINTSYQGIYKQFVETMRSLQVAVVETIGKPFDPTVHEAVGREESQQYKEGIVMEEIQRGFVLGGRLLRPATVKVSTGSGPARAPPPTTTEVEPEAAVGSIEDSAPATPGSI